MDLSALVKLVSIVLVLGIGLCARLWTGRPDSPVEQQAEKIIYQETGLNIDLSPDSMDANDGDNNV